jgi:lipoprotein-anchoring transpeptidase ErfK/SrfK
MVKKKVQKNSFNWPFFLILLISVLVLGFFIIFSSLVRPFCASSGNCKESMELSVENNVTGVFNGQKVIPPKIDLAKKEVPTKVLGEASNSGEKHIYVDLTSQTLKAYQGNDLYMTAAVSTGKWHKTPTGEFTIWSKYRATKMSGGTGADYYYLPNVPYVMFFSGPDAPAGAGFSLHGAYWHNNFGHPMSHGCVNMRTVDAQKLYDWVSPDTKGNVTPATESDPGTKITIYGQAPI